MRPCLQLALATLLLLAVSSPAGADELLKPTKAQTAQRKALKRLRGDEKTEMAKTLSLEYLAKWEASGRKPTPADGYALAQFRQSAEQFVKAADGFRAVQAHKACAEKTRDYAASAEAQLLLNPAVREALGKPGLLKAGERLSAYAKVMAATPARAKSRTTLLKVLARVHELGGQLDKAHELRLQILKEDPKSLTSLVQPLVQGLLGSTYSMDGYEALRTKAAATLKALRDTQAGDVAEKKKKLALVIGKLKAVDPSALDAENHLKKTSTKGMSREEKAVYKAWRSFNGSDAKLRALDVHEKPFAMLGKPAAAFTLEREYGDVVALADLKGKVVVLDFFATWPDLNNLPIMRDFMRDYGEKGLTVLGVTVSASVVYETRYDTDPDMASKRTRGARLFYAARLATEKEPANEGQAIYAEEAYRQLEMEAIGAFIKNHELSWPVVLIDQEEPASKYALGGWPHLVILDKQGRVRFIKGAAISRDKTQAVAAIRAVIEALLAE